MAPPVALSCRPGYKPANIPPCGTGSYGVYAGEEVTPDASPCCVSVHPAGHRDQREEDCQQKDAGEYLEDYAPVSRRESMVFLSESIDHRRWAPSGRSALPESSKIDMKGVLITGVVFSKPSSEIARYTSGRGDVPVPRPFCRLGDPGYLAASVSARSSATEAANL